jgi:Ca2+-binding EF-hand superfamily protein
MNRALGALALLAASAVAAEAQPVRLPADAVAWMRLRMNERVQQPPHLWSVEQLEAFLAPLFAAASRDGIGITPEDREQRAAAAVSQARMPAMSQFVLADVRGEGRVDRATMAAVQRLQAVNNPAAISQVEATTDRYFLENDEDGDGVVTYREAFDAAGRRAAPHSEMTVRTPPAALDLDGDGIIAKAEFAQVLRAVFDEIDTDRDGRISQAEANRFQSEVVQGARREAEAHSRRQVALAAAKQNAARCGIPHWDGETTLAVISPQGGRAIADVSLGAPAKVAVFNVHIEPGDRRLSVVLNAVQPAIWQFAGQVERVAAVFLAQPVSNAKGARSGSGVIGIAAGKIKFATRSGCLPFVDDQLEGKPRLAAALGRSPDVVVAEGQLSTVRLPSGAALNDGAFPNLIELPKDGPGAALWKMSVDKGQAMVRVDPDASSLLRRLAAPACRALPGSRRSSTTGVPRSPAGRP